MKRRSFLGLFGGAAVAGPRVASDALKSMTPTTAASAINDIGGYVGSGAYAVKPVELNSTWVPSEIAYLRRMLAGDLTDEERMSEKELRDCRHQTIALDVVSLRSVTEASKLRMIRDQQRAVRDAYRRESWSLNLASLLARAEG